MYVFSIPVHILLVHLFKLLIIRIMYTVIVQINVQCDCSINFIDYAKRLWIKGDFHTR